jgi:hypothetical protein
MAGGLTAFGSVVDSLTKYMQIHRETSREKGLKGKK